MKLLEKQKPERFQSRWKCSSVRRHQLPFQIKKPNCDPPGIASPLEFRPAQAAATIRAGRPGVL
jgi:hypothetical protein